MTQSLSLVGRSLIADECLELTEGEVLICKWPPEDSESFFTGDSFPIRVLETCKIKTVYIDFMLVSRVATKILRRFWGGPLILDP